MQIGSCKVYDLELAWLRRRWLNFHLSSLVRILKRGVGEPTADAGEQRRTDVTDVTGFIAASAIRSRVLPGPRLSNP